MPALFEGGLHRIVETGAIGVHREEAVVGFRHADCTGGPIDFGLHLLGALAGDADVDGLGASGGGDEKSGAGKSPVDDLLKGLEKKKKK